MDYKDQKLIKDLTAQVERQVDEQHLANLIAYVSFLEQAQISYTPRPILAEIESRLHLDEIVAVV